MFSLYLYYSMCRITEKVEKNGLLLLMSFRSLNNKFHQKANFVCYILLNHRKIIYT